MKIKQPTKEYYEGTTMGIILTSCILLMIPSRWMALALIVLGMYRHTKGIKQYDDAKDV